MVEVWVKFNEVRQPADYDPETGIVSFGGWKIRPIETEVVSRILTPERYWVEIRETLRHRYQEIGELTGERTSRAEFEDIFVGRVPLGEVRGLWGIGDLVAVEPGWQGQPVYLIVPGREHLLRPEDRERLLSLWREAGWVDGGVDIDVIRRWAEAALETFGEHAGDEDVFLHELLGSAQDDSPADGKHVPAFLIPQVADSPTRCVRLFQSDDGAVDEETIVKEYAPDLLLVRASGCAVMSDTAWDYSWWVLGGDFDAAYERLQRYAEELRESPFLTVDFGEDDG